MATVTGLTAARMEEMEDATIISGHITGDNLILTTKGGTDVTAGNVRGPMGPSGGPPIGSLLPCVLAIAPTNYVLCFGQTLFGANATYPDLWAVVDPTWKSGSNLIIPDLRGRTPIGKDNMGGAAANRITSAICGINGTLMGAAGGDQRMHQHNHTINDPQHNHGTGQTLYGGGFVNFAPGSQGTLTASTGSPTNITINNNGNGTAQNVPPSIVLNWILRLQ